jgi:hypothetical protein
VIAVLACALALSACETRELTSPTPTAPGSAPSASPKESVDAPARAAIEQSLTVLSACTILDEEIAMLDYLEADRCDKMDPQGVAELDRRVDTLVTAVGRAAPLDPAGASFVDEVKLYRAWIDLVSRTKDARGTAALYQKLARKWNEWKPDAKVEVDPPTVLMDYFGVDESRIEHMMFYLKNSRDSGRKRYEAFRAAGRALTWTRGPNGVYIDERNETIRAGW